MKISSVKNKPIMIEFQLFYLIKNNLQKKVINYTNE